jgi:hypothetical protein
MSNRSAIFAIDDERFIGIDLGDGDGYLAAITAIERSTERFNVMYCGTWRTDSGLFSLAAEYRERCEAYDRLVCTGPVIHNEIMPAGSHELFLINRNASAVRRELAERAVRLGYTEQQFKEALRHA